MKMRKLLCVAMLLLLAVGTVSAQKTYKYRTFENDPFNAREYTLDNGLKVYMSVYKDVPKIQTYIAVRAGSKNDPHETTGLAHYLEHMMFKGTESMGTKDWEKEKVLIQKIEDLFEVYRMFDDSLTRATIYRMIDSLSYEASQLAIANEYDKSMSAIGSTGTNAYTAVDQTVYIENIPSNQLETWCEIEADRFKHLVLRLFHTELETIYEEKNMYSTNDGRRVYEAILAALFPHHPYGTQTTIGEADHLKNPSMRNIRKFIADYYVPNNMCISLAGDFDPDEAIKIIDKYWGDIKPGNVPVLSYENETPITEVQNYTLSGQDPENLTIAYRVTSKVGDHDRLVADLMDEMLCNGKCGIIDVNLNQKQLCLSAYSGMYAMNDYGAFVLGGSPNEGQTLEQLKELLLKQVEQLKRGEFDESLLQAAINNRKLSLMKQAESNGSRASQMMNAFLQHRDWADVCNDINELAKITKKDIVDYANKLFLDNNYVVINKLQGTPDPVKKVAKPPITPIEVSRDAESDFLKDIKARTVKPIEPKYVNFDKELTKAKLNNGTEVLYVQNTENKTFTLQYRFEFGSNADKTIDFASSLLGYLGTSKHTKEQLNVEFYKLACNYSFSVGGDAITVGVSGLSENMVPAMKLLEEIVSDAQPDDEALKTLVDRIVKSRNDNKQSQGSAFSALCNYAIYGPENSPVLDVLSEKELRAYTAKQLTDAIHDIFNYKHRVLYYGPESVASLKSIVSSNHAMPSKYKKCPKNKEITPLQVKEPTVYFVDFDAEQVRLRSFFRSVKYDLSMLPVVNLYNEYFGGSMNAIVFQEMREKRSLAYSAWGGYVSPGRPNGFFNNQTFIGTQNDKVIDALTAFNELYEQMPVAQANFDLAKEASLSGIRTARTSKFGIISNYLGYEKMGYDTKKPINQMLFNAYQTLTINDIVNFNNKYLKGQKMNYMLLGREKDMDFDALKKYGKIKKLTLEDIFGY